MKIKYDQLSKISLALIYFLLDMINSPNSNTSWRRQTLELISMQYQFQFPHGKLQF